MAAAEQFLDAAGFDRAPWLAVAFGAGIACWFALPGAGWWAGLIALCLLLAGGAWTVAKRREDWPYLTRALWAVALLVAAGCAVVWSKSALVGAPPIARPQVVMLDARILSRQNQPAEQRARLVLATRLPGDERAVRVRINLPDKLDRQGIAPGARMRVRARLMPPAAPMLPGGYNFARRAWFEGLAATGSAIAAPTLVEPGKRAGLFDNAQARLSSHVQRQLDGSQGGIAATLASGDRGGIAEADAQAMRDSGLAHLLSISGLHVSALIGAAYLIALRLLAFWPWLTLRVRLPLVASAIGALAGIGYTMLTGAEVPTVRSCVGALLVLAALAMGREALSMRLLAVAAFIVLLFWPESLIGPSFQMSFAAVAVIIALNGSETIRRFLAPREEGWSQRALRYVAMTLLTGFVIEIVLMPIALVQFHRAGIYGALANVVAIPLTTVVAMPLVAIALVFDLIGMGAPFWWLAGKAISVLLAIAHLVSAQPGAVTMMPDIGEGAFMLFVAGGLWLGLWTRRIRLLGLVPAAAGAVSLLALEPPDLLISGDGRHVGITGEVPGSLLVIRRGRSDYVRDNLNEVAGMQGELVTLDEWPGARCSPDLCAVTLKRKERDWRLLIARTRERVSERSLAAACDRSDIVIADRWLPRSCRPAWIKADRNMLERTGGLAIDLDDRRVETVAGSEGTHGWWRPAPPRQRPRQRSAAAVSPDTGTGPASAAPSSPAAPTAPDSTAPSHPEALPEAATPQPGSTKAQ